jgi:hypothetical protein
MEASLLSHSPPTPVRSHAAQRNFYQAARRIFSKADIFSLVFKVIATIARTLEEQVARRKIESACSIGLERCHGLQGVMVQI